MKVELSIKDDAELRFLIKDMIRGQVTSIARSDIEQIIKEVVGDKTAKLSDLMAKEITKVVTEFFGGTYMRDGPGRQMIKDEIQKQVSATLKKVLQQGG